MTTRRTLPALDGPLARIEGARALDPAVRALGLAGAGGERGGHMAIGRTVWTVWA